MIDIEKANKEFDKYVNLFNPKDTKIKLKIEHIKRVSELSREIAKNLNLDEEHIRLAEVIGLFHDIGRFKQIEIYNTFRDKDSVNHAEYSIKVLYEDNLIEKFDIEEKYKETIKIAILNHNKNKIQEGLSKEELLYSKIIRDADKLDIYYTLLEYDFRDLFWFSNFDCEKISDDIMNQFIKLHAIDFSTIKSNADQISIFYAYIYDLYFEFSKEYVKSKKYLEKLTDKIYKNFSSNEVKKQVNIILDISTNFLKSE